MKRSDIANALDRGDISPEDLRAILDGWRPGRRGRKPNLMRQARLLAATTLLSEHMGITKTKEVLLAAGGFTSMSAFDRMLDRSRKSWLLLPPFEPVHREDGKTELSVMLQCQHSDHYGYSVTLALIPENWGF